MRTGGIAAVILAAVLGVAVSAKEPEKAPAIRVAVPKDGVRLRQTLEVSWALEHGTKMVPTEVRIVHDVTLRPVEGEAGVVEIRYDRVQVQAKNVTGEGGFDSKTATRVRRRLPWRRPVSA